MEIFLIFVIMAVRKLGVENPTMISHIYELFFLLTIKFFCVIFLCKNNKRKIYVKIYHYNATTT